MIDRFDWKSIFVSLFLVFATADDLSDTFITKEESMVIVEGLIYVVEPERTWTNEFMG